MIKNSLDWNKLESKLYHQAAGLLHRRDIQKMIKNINIEISQLSIAEIDTRCGKKRSAEEILLKVNQDIEIVEEYILIATLLG